MAEGEKFLGYGQIPEIALDDVIIVLDKSNTTQSPEGSTVWGSGQQIIDFVNKYANAAVENRYLTIAEMLADQASQGEGNLQFVSNATADPTVSSGSAYYEKLEASTADLGNYTKLTAAQVQVLENPLDWLTKQVKLKTTNVNTETGSISNGDVFVETTGTEITAVLLDVPYTGVMRLFSHLLSDGKTVLWVIYNITQNSSIYIEITSLTSLEDDTLFKVNIANVIDTDDILEGDVLQLFLPYVLLGDAGLKSIEIASLPFTLIKNKTIPNTSETLEVDDIIKGFATNGDYIEAKYLGGDATDFENEEVYIIFNGI